MAIYHFSGQIISRSTKSGGTRSAVACASYRSGEKLFDERSQRTKSYYRMVKPVSKIIAPPNAPLWVYNRERLWNEVEKKERQYNSQLAREFNVALPVELNDKEQNKLAYDFCKKAFVDRGMVADISIHRDNKENPHFHVMLTIRPFMENGEWGAKCRKEYVEKDGKKKAIRVNSTNWNDRETMKEWRKQWEVMTNNYLKKNGINERVSCESNRTLDKEKVATIHEGYAARKMKERGAKSDRVSQNETIKDYNETVTDLNKYKREKQEKERSEMFFRAFTPKEKNILKNTAKELKIFVNYTNINERIEQLERWKKSLEFKDDNLDKFKKLQRIDKEEELIKGALNILENEADRFIKKNYQDLDLDKLNIDEKINIVDTTINDNKKLNSIEIMSIKGEIYEDNLRKSLTGILNNRSRFTLSIVHDIKHMETAFEELRSKYNIDFSKPETAKNAPDSVLDKMEKLLNRKTEMEEALEIMEEIYDSDLEQMYPEWEGIYSLNLVEKELFIMGKEYYGKTIMPDDFGNPPKKYDIPQQKEILNLLANKNNHMIIEKYPDFMFNSEAYKNMFYMECISNIDLLDKHSQELVNNYFDKDNFMKNFKVFNNEFEKIRKGEKPGESTGNINNNYKHDNRRSLFIDMVGIVINEVENRIKEDQYEKERIKNKKKKRQNRGHYSL